MSTLKKILRATGDVPMGTIMPDFYPLAIFVASQFFHVHLLFWGQKKVYFKIICIYCH